MLALDGIRAGEQGGTTCVRRRRGTGMVIVRWQRVARVLSVWVPGTKRDRPREADLIVLSTDARS
jgi:hypothetical protein